MTDARMILAARPPLFACRQRLHALPHWSMRVLITHAFAREINPA
jgi:hypothetical protein